MDKNITKSLSKYDIKRIIFSIKSYIFILIIGTITILRGYEIFNLEKSLNFKFNVWDIYFYNVADDEFTIFLIGLMYLWIISELIFNKEITILLILKAKYRFEWIFSKIISLFIITAILLAIYHFASFIVGIVILGYGETWSLGLEAMKTSKIQSVFIKDYYNPLQMTIIQISLNYLGLLFLGMIAITASIIIKNKNSIYGIIPCVCILIIEIITYSKGATSEFSLRYNMFMNVRFKSGYEIKSLFFSLIYFLLPIIILIISSIFISDNTDFQLAESGDE